MMPEHLAQIISPLVNMDQTIESQELLDAAVGLFALILLALSLSAYRRARLRSLLVVSVAFGLFAVEVAVRQLDILVFTVGSQYVEVITTILDFLILLLFFVAVVLKK